MQVKHDIVVVFGPIGLINHIRRGFRVASSNLKGNARASNRGIGKNRIHVFLCT